MYEIDDVVSRFLLVCTDGDNLCFSNSRGFQDVLAGAVTEVNAEAKFSRCTDTIGRTVNHGYVDTTGKKNLRCNLPVS